MDDELISIPTSRFGVLTVDAERVVTFPDAIPGLVDLAQVVVLQAAGTEPFCDLDADDAEAFCWLQSVSNPDMAVLGVSPWAVNPDYEFEFDDTMLGSPRPEDLAVLCLVSVHGDTPTANLRAPVLMNLANRTARQIILTDDRLPIRAPMGV